MKKIAFSFLFFIALSAFGQQVNINNYKYVIVPDRFDFLKTVDQYQTSSLTKFLLEKKGFVVYLSNEKLPEDLVQNRCNGLTATVIDDSSMFTVKSKIELKDCYGTVVYVSETGKSKEKEYKKSYHEAIRNAFETMEDLTYKYVPLKKVSEVKKATTPEVVVVKEVISVPVKEIVSQEKVVVSNHLETLYSQEINNGFQLVNTTPAVVYQLLKTKVKDVFILKDKNGILYKNGDNWIAEYYENDVLVVKQYAIKF
ncbi:hypothetical protein BTO14_16040 [Polaribacter butkevichii]|uniref:Uncharacterized protein n=1 Tax=Polaribacter butkevichii TaxID=218490 RepID=A0A2P6C9Y1_9FLAO|nr:hypothetical protein BTO14_16040 [Polaribacter butkevichii]